MILALRRADFKCAPFSGSALYAAAGPEGAGDDGGFLTTPAGISFRSRIRNKTYWAYTLHRGGAMLDTIRQAWGIYKDERPYYGKVPAGERAK
jgi:hypothetical protein